jgi:4-methyl-5(b-hydroxyethyl)-thiazole monophosphate biosynthesis
MDAIIRPEKADAGHNADSGRLREVVVLSKKVYIFLADGFEDIEGLTVVDLLRRAQIDIKTVSIKDTKEVQTAHGISLLTDLLFDEVDFTDADMLVLPGGMPGTKYLAGSKPLTDLLTDFYNKGKKIAAICAAPSVFSGLGFLKGRKATSYPSFMEVIAGDGAVTSEDSVVVDGNVTTSRGLGTAVDFALSLITQLENQEKAEEIAESVVYRH